MVEEVTMERVLKRANYPWQHLLDVMFICRDSNLANHASLYLQKLLLVITRNYHVGYEYLLYDSRDLRLNSAIVNMASRLYGDVNVVSTTLYLRMDST